MIQVNLDCEGPITQNDNAYELCEEYIPAGGDFFARVSKYDDYLADVEKRKGYKAGDTLKLVLPFLKAWGVTSEVMEKFSESTLRMLPGAREMLPALAKAYPSFIISTSYRQYLDALCRVTGFPDKNVYCTDVDLDRYELPEEEIHALKDMASEIASQPMLEWSDTASGADDLDERNRATLSRLEEIFWVIIPGMKAGAIVDDVNPVGGYEKAESVKDSLKRTGLGASDVFYAGDSITDVQALELVKDGGGAAVSFNGNSYAIRAARWACLSENTMIIAALAELFDRMGLVAFEKMPFDSKGCVRGDAFLGYLESSGVNSSLTASFKDSKAAYTLEFYDILKADIKSLVKKSEKFRKGVRGIALGELG